MSTTGGVAVVEGCAKQMEQPVQRQAGESSPSGQGTKRRPLTSENELGEGGLRGGWRVTPLPSS